MRPRHASRSAWVAGLALTVLLSLACAAPVAAPDAASATFTIDGKPVTLVAGRSEREAAPGSATKIVTMLGAEKAEGDVDADGRPDVAVTLVYQPGGSGSFTYVAAVLNPTAGATGTNAVLVGDRVKVTVLRLDGKTIVVEYLDRRPGEPFATAPSVPTTKRLVTSGGKLVVQ